MINLKNKLAFMLFGFSILIATNSIVFADECDDCLTEFFDRMHKCETSWDNSNMDQQAQQDADICVNDAKNKLHKCRHLHRCQQ